MEKEGQGTRRRRERGQGDNENIFKSGIKGIENLKWEESSKIWT